MDFELIENLNEKQVDELYTDLVDGNDDKLSEFICYVQLTSLSPSRYFDKDGNLLNKDNTFSGDNYTFGAIWSNVVGYIGYDGELYRIVPWETNTSSSIRVETYIKQRRAGSDDEFIDKGRSVSYTISPSNNDRHNGERVSGQYLECDNVTLCTKYFNDELFKIKHCNMTHALEYESGESDVREDSGVLFTYAVYTSCSNIWDFRSYLLTTDWWDNGNWWDSEANVHWHSDMFFHAYMEDSNFLLKNPGEGFAHVGSVLYNDYFEFAYYNNGIFETITETRKQHFRSAGFGMGHGIYCKNMR